MAYSFADYVLSQIGKGYLFLRFGKQEKVRQELSRKYEGVYRNAGLALLFDMLMALAVVAVVVFLAGGLYLVLK